MHLLQAPPLVDFILTLLLLPQLPPSRTLLPPLLLPLDRLLPPLDSLLPPLRLLVPPLVRDKCICGRR
jgi:hypothetical protein